MAKHREVFLKGTTEKAHSLPSIAEQIFELAAKFAGYGFNKGHAAAYAQVAFQTAYLKANYPVEFLAASMTLDIGNTDRLNIFRQEAQRLNIRIASPDINRSGAHFTCDSEKGVIFYALAAVKGVGKQAMDHVVVERKANGPFRSIGDFSKRIDPKLVNKCAFESLVRAGAFDGLSPNRKQLVEFSGHRAELPQRAPRRSVRRDRCRCSGKLPRPTTSVCPHWKTGCRTKSWARNSAPSASISPAIRSMPTARR